MRDRHAKRTRQTEAIEGGSEEVRERASQRLFVCCLARCLVFQLVIFQGAILTCDLRIRIRIRIPESFNSPSSSLCFVCFCFWHIGFAICGSNVLRVNRNLLGCACISMITMVCGQVWLSINVNRH